MTRPFYWSLRREIWEHRALYMAPLIAAGVALLAFTISTIGMPERRLHALTLDPASQARAILMPYHMTAMVIVFTTLIVAAFYCLGALHNERRDRSILFWKSLPVSDLVTVLAKATVPIAV